MKKCFIVLENGSMFEGVRFGAPLHAVGEITFTTSVGGHMGTLTDPCHQGQILVQTFPTVGNYGVIPAEMDSDQCHLSGYVVREWCKTPVNFRCEGNIDQFLQLHGVAGVYGVDTRQITRIIRECGSMNAAIVDEVTPEVIQSLKARGKVPCPISEALKAARTTHLPSGEGNVKCRIALINYGAPHHVIEALQARGCQVEEFPYDASPEDVLSSGVDAVVLSDGPGDPLDVPEGVMGQVKALIGRVPMLGIGLGHLLLVLAHGGSTYKLKHGHRGANQPIRRIEDGQMYITALNQGYASLNALPEGCMMTYLNYNDHSVAGVAYPAERSMSVQFVPDGSLGPLKTDFIYDQFIERVVG